MRIFASARASSDWDDVEVHLVTVKVGVVRRTDGEVESEGFAFHDTHLVHHHRHPYAAMAAG